MPGAGAAAEPQRAVPLYATVLGWVEGRLSGRGYARPLCKRLAVLLVGLLAGERATLGAVAGAVRGLAVSGAKEESIARRLLRVLEDARLDPERLLPDLFAGLLPELLKGQLAAHAANAGAGAAHHARFRPLRLVVDETSVDERAHVLVVGLAYQGLVLPLAARVWRQNAPLAEGEYWAALGQLLWQAHGLLPPELRGHAVLLADRAYGVPRMLDLLGGLGWAFVLRAAGGARVRLPDGAEVPLRALAPRPGALWLGGTDPRAADAGPSAADEAAQVFKGAGWRRCRVVAAWAVGEAEPWLLLTDLPAAAARLRDYAARWAIERTFLAWKGHGWDLEACGLRDPARLGRLLSGLAAATLWRLACALPLAAAHLDDLAARAARRPAGPPRATQLPLPWGRPDPADPPPAAARPWAAKFSLLSWGAKAARAADLRTTTPALRWELPPWDAPTWSGQCRLAYAPPAA
jgi:hypothetical protein